MIKNPKISGMSIALAFVGTITGAGYASGQELMQFFGDFGSNGLIGIIVATLAFFAFCTLCMMLTKRMNTDNYAALLSPRANPFIMMITDGLMFLFLFGIFVIMVAGNGSLLASQAGLSPIIGKLLLIVLTIITVWWGLSSIQKAFQIFVPVLVIGAGLVAIIVMINPQIDPSANIVPLKPQNPLVGNWYSAALLYVFFNMLPGIGVLAPFGYLAKDSKTIIRGALLSAIGLMGLASFLIFAIIQNYSLVYTADMPMLAIAKSISPTMGYIYTILLFIAITSTAFGLMFAMIARLKTTSWFQSRYEKPLILLISILSLIGSQIGFVQLIAFIYPIYGYISIAGLLSMIYNFFYYKPEKKS